MCECYQNKYNCECCFVFLSNEWDLYNLVVMIHLKFLWVSRLSLNNKAMYSCYFHRFLFTFIKSLNSKQKYF